MELSNEQRRAADAAATWFAAGDRPVFTIGGYAGTGKTTLVKQLVEDLDVSALFAAYTGKAALVMQRTGGVDAQTIHSLIYKPVLPDRKRCEELYGRIKKCEDKGEKKKLREELDEAQKVSFILNNDSDLSHSDLLVLDECSMVNHEMLNDLLSFKVPIIALGDPGQLPPIEGAGALFKQGYDAELTEIHRQARDNPIIEMSVRARNGIPIPFASDGRARHLPYESSTEIFEQYDQVLCGKNVTRRKINLLVRDSLGLNLPSPYPAVGDSLICLRNDPSLNLFNGLKATVTEVGQLLDSTIELFIRTELQNDTRVLALRAYFDAYNDPEALENVRWWERRGSQEFDYGYAITVHKAQGSQWDNVLLIDDKFYSWNRAMRKRWLYTAITRAAESFTLVS